MLGIMFHDPFAGIVALFVHGIFAFSVFIFIFAKHLTMKFSIVFRFLKEKEKLAKVTLSQQIPPYTTVEIFCHRIFSDCIDKATYPNLEPYFISQMGNIMLIVYYHERTLRRIIGEMRLYAFVLIMLGMAGFFFFLAKIGFEFQFIKLWEVAGKEPFHLIGILELIMLMFFLVRLGVELVLMTELLPEHLDSRQNKPITDQASIP